jgi:hypothetical protein
MYNKNSTHVHSNHFCKTHLPLHGTLARVVPCCGCARSERVPQVLVLANSMQPAQHKE